MSLKHGFMYSQLLSGVMGQKFLVTKANKNLTPSVNMIPLVGCLSAYISKVVDSASTHHTPCPFFFFLWTKSADILGIGDII